MVFSWVCGNSTVESLWTVTDGPAVASSVEGVDFHSTHTVGAGVDCRKGNHKVLGGKRGAREVGLASVG